MKTHENSETGAAHEEDYLIQLRNGKNIKINLKHFLSPAEPGEINFYFFRELTRLLNRGEPLLLFDFVPGEENEVVGLTEVPRWMAEDTFIFNPTGKRIISLFGDFGKDLEFNLYNLFKVIKSINPHVRNRDLSSEIKHFAEIFTELLASSKEKIPLFNLLFLYDETCFENLLKEFNLQIENPQEIRNKLEPWFHYFNEKTLTKYYLANPFFVRSLNFNSPLNVSFLFCYLNLEKIPINDAKWMADFVLTSRIYEIYRNNFEIMLPLKFKIDDFQNPDEELLALVNKIYKKSGDYLILSPASAESVSHSEVKILNAKLPNGDKYRDLNIFIVDDDINIIDINRFFKDYPDINHLENLQNVNVFLQKTVGNPRCMEKPHKTKVSIAAAIYQLSSLKWGRPEDSVRWEQADFVEHLRDIYFSFIEFAFYSGQTNSEVLQALSARFNTFDSVTEGSENYPLGMIEDIETYFENELNNLNNFK